MDSKTDFFIDGLIIEQEHKQELPFLSGRVSIDFDTVTGKRIKSRQYPVQHEGSYSTSIRIRVNGSRITMSGNPSRFNRPDNLQGLLSVDDCVAVYNNILRNMNLPVFTKCQERRFSETMDKSGKPIELPADGAVLKELHITTNRAVGQGNEFSYLRGLSQLPYRNGHPFLYLNGCTVDWRHLDGKANGFIYSSVYIKHLELQEHLIPSLEKLLKKQFKLSLAATSPEIQALIAKGVQIDLAKHCPNYKDITEALAYVKNLQEYCKQSGVVRFEQKLKTRFLFQNNLHLWGLADMGALEKLQTDFVNLDKVFNTTSTDYDLMTIADRLVESGACSSYRSANATASVAMCWMANRPLKLAKRQTETHRARLRKIGIDIKHAFDVNRHSPVIVRHIREIEVAPLSLPDWYRHPVVKPLLQVVR